MRADLKEAIRASDSDTLVLGLFNVFIARDLSRTEQLSEVLADLKQHKPDVLTWALAKKTAIAERFKGPDLDTALKILDSFE